MEQAVASSGPVLELGCGTGRVSVPVAQAGMAVVGIDASPSLIKVDSLAKTRFEEVPAL